MVELVVVLFIVLIVAAFAIPNIMQAVYNQRLRSSAADLSVLMQQARILAGENNTTYSIQYTTLSGAQVAYIDVNNDGIGRPPSRSCS
jgi:Tfp pilus assembly protein FimT